MTKNVKNSLEMAREFAETIVESQEYKKFIEASRKFNRDSEAKELINEFQKKQINLYSGKFDPKLMDELKELQEKINKNSTINQYLEAQADLVNILRRANNVISLRIGTQFAYSQGGGCCG